MQLTIRPISIPQDYMAIAAVLEAENPGWGESAEELAYNDATHDPAHYHATIVAEESSPPTAMIGVAFVGHDGLAYQEHSFQMNLRVHPEWQGKGVGKALYGAVLATLAPKEAHTLVAQVWHTHPRAARFLTDHGFVESWRRVDSLRARTGQAAPGYTK
ncbi:MAG: N-acetyltransferase [Caldilinea sp. CFX5]|nr:N-acetyltransferase [Caldilinea sp. CFX5]